MRWPEWEAQGVINSFISLPTVRNDDPDMVCDNGSLMQIVKITKCLQVLYTEPLPGDSQMHESCSTPLVSCQTSLRGMLPVLSRTFLWTPSGNTSMIGEPHVLDAHTYVSRTEQGGVKSCDRQIGHICTAFSPSSAQHRTFLQLIMSVPLWSLKLPMFIPQRNLHAGILLLYLCFMIVT